MIARKYFKLCIHQDIQFHSEAKVRILPFWPAQVKENIYIFWCVIYKCFIANSVHHYVTNLRKKVIALVDYWYLCSVVEKHQPWANGRWLDYCPIICHCAFSVRLIKPPIVTVGISLLIWIHLGYFAVVNMYFVQDNFCCTFTCTLAFFFLPQW